MGLVPACVLSECDLTSGNWPETQSALTFPEDDGRLSGCWFALSVGRSGIRDGLFWNFHRKLSFQRTDYSTNNDIPAIIFVNTDFICILIILLNKFPTHLLI